MTSSRRGAAVLLVFAACVPNPNFGASGETEGSGDESSDGGQLGTCGDGIVDIAEACDDANSSNNDGCLTNCGHARCGDGHVWQGHEDCDDGNLTNTDACTSTCEFANCGDGHVRHGVESCDDGNTDNSDDCVADCEFARCGDGYLHAGVEQCDDGNDISDDGCSNACEIELNLVFVSSGVYTGNLGGIAGADDECRQLAELADLPGDYKAWLSDGGNSPSTHFTRSDQPYVLTDGTIIASNWSELTDGSLDAPINRTEFGQEVSSYVWTSTTATSNVVNSNSVCFNWTDGSDNNSGSVGYTSDTNSGWSYAASDTCSSSYHIYCFRQLTP